jgi:hypothetical protein
MAPQSRHSYERESDRKIDVACNMFVNTAAVTNDLSFTSGPPPLGESFALCGGYNAPATAPTVLACGR